MVRLSPWLCTMRDYFQHGSSNKAISCSDEHQRPRRVNAIWWTLLLLSGEPLKFTFYFGTQIWLGSLMMSLKFGWHKMLMRKYSLMENSPNRTIGCLCLIGATGKVLLDHDGSQLSSAKSLSCPSEKAESLVFTLPWLALGPCYFTASVFTK